MATKTLQTLAKIAFALAFCCGAFCRSEEPSAVVTPFQKGDRVAFIGDSITAWGQYTAIVHLFYQTRFPERKFSIYNTALSGDTAFYARLRAEPAGNLFRNDILRNRPNVAVLMLGMNDSRHADIWGQVGEVKQERMAKAAETYRESMDELIEKLRTNGVRRVIPIISCPYDETTARGNVALIGKNGFIRDVTGDYLRELSEQRGFELIDFNTPMLAINSRQQAKDPQFSLADMGDRVHPLKMGHFVMAYLFLKAMGLDSTVATIEIDTAGCRVLTAGNCEITNLQKTAEGVSFDCLTRSLPFPTTAFQFDSVVPFDEELNQERLLLHGLLDAGSYAVLIDGTSIGTCTAQQLNHGINLALNPLTPQYQQALKAEQLSSRSWLADLSKRHLIWNLRLMHILKLDTPEKQKAWLKRRTPPAREIDRVREVEFLRLLDQGRLEDAYSASIREAESLNDEAYKACVPKRRSYQVIRTEK